MSKEASRFKGISQQEAQRDLNEQKQQAMAYLRHADTRRSSQSKATRQREQFKLGLKRTLRLG